MKRTLLFKRLILLVFTISLTTINAQIMHSPGNVHPTSLRAWFKVDEYNSTTPKTWKNSVINNGLSELTTGNAPDQGELWNYNPTLKFDGKVGNNGFRNKVLKLTDILEKDGGTTIAITSYTGYGKEDSDDRGVCGYFNTGTDNHEFSLHQNLSYFRAHTDYRNAGETTWGTPISSTPSIRSTQFTSEKGTSSSRNKGELKIYFNNLIDNTELYNTYNTGTLNDRADGYFGIGEIPQTQQYFKGLIAEVIVYAKSISNSERLRTESYLAIKYGTTLGTTTNPVSYTSSNEDKAEIIWTGNTEYQNNIIGIGRDDISKLVQKQSHQMDDSLRIYLGDLRNNNKENLENFSKDRSFVVIGSNEKLLNATDASNTEMYNGLSSSNSNCELFSKIERQWKVERTNMPDKFNLDIKLNESAKLHLINPDDLRLFVDTDGKFGNGWEGCYANGDNGLGISYNQDLGMITIKGINLEHIPDNNVRYISIGSVHKGSPLPVGLSSFEGACYRTNVELEWVTESETDNDYFTIENSTDGINYEVIATIDGQGTKNSATTYSRTYFSNQVGISYYRLSQTDFDGKETILKTISSNCEGDLEVIIHPNPTNNGVYLTLNGASESNFNLAIYDLTGKMISQQQIEGSSYIELPNQKGIYLLKYELNGSIMVEKIVKY